MSGSFHSLTLDNTLEANALNMAKGQLSPKYLTFVEAILSGESGAKAIITAGYEVKSPQGRTNKANQLLKKDVVRAYLGARYQEMQKKSEITLDEVKGNARNILARCMQAIPVVDKKTGEPTGDWTFDSNGANKSNDTLMRLAGLDKTEKGDRVQVQFNVQVSRPEDAKALAEGVVEGDAPKRLPEPPGQV